MKEKENVQEVKQNVEPEIKEVKKKRSYKFIDRYIKAVKEDVNDNMPENILATIKEELIKNVSVDTSFKSLIHALIWHIYMRYGTQDVLDDYKALCKKQSNDISEITCNWQTIVDDIESKITKSTNWNIALGFYSFIITVTLIFLLIIR